MLKTNRRAVDEVESGDAEHDNENATEGANTRELPSAEAVAEVTTAAEKAGLEGATEAAKGVAADQTEPLAKLLSDVGKAVSKALVQEVKVQRAFHKALGQIALTATQAYDSVEVLIALAAQQGIKATKATLATPYLLPIRVAMPELDPKTASLWARAFNYLSACGIAGDQFDVWLKRYGVVELAKREAQRQKIRKGGATAKPAGDPIETFCQQRRALALNELMLPDEAINEGGLALVVVGRAGGKLVAYDLDDDAKRVLAAVRQANKRGLHNAWPGAARAQAAE